MMKALLANNNFDDNGKLLFSREEAAALLGVSTHTVARDIRLGKIRFRKYGRRVLVPREEVLRIASEGL